MNLLEMFDSSKDEVENLPLIFDITKEIPEPISSRILPEAEAQEILDMINSGL